MTTAAEHTVIGVRGRRETRSAIARTTGFVRGVFMRAGQWWFRGWTGYVKTIRPGQ